MATPSTIARAQAIVAEIAASGAARITREFPLVEPECHPLEKIDYVLSNEQGQNIVLQTLAQSSSPENGIHIGFSGLFNLDIMATRRSAVGIICDINPQMMTLWALVKKNVGKEKTPEAFLRSFWDEFSQSGAFYGYLQGAGEIIYSIEELIPYATKQGWLSSQESYDYIATLYREGKIFHRELDLKSTKHFDDLRLWASKEGFVFDTIYDSNIVEWLVGPEAQRAREENLLKLITANTFVISAWKEGQFGQHPTLRIETGKVPRLKYEKTQKPCPTRFPETAPRPSAREDATKRQLFESDSDSD